EDGNQCKERKNQSCTWGCGGGGCLPAPTGTGNITATPLLVRSGETSRIQWTTENMKADTCLVSEDNPEITNSGSDITGAFTSGILQRRTIFTLICTDVGDRLFTDSVTVNIIPVFQEPRQ